MEKEKAISNLQAGDVATLNGKPGIVQAVSREYEAGFFARKITTITIEFVEYPGEEQDGAVS